MEAHVKLVFHYAGHQPLTDDYVVLAFDRDSYLVEAPDVMIVLFIVLNCTRYCCDLIFSVKLFVL